ncbi:ribosomal-protein-alanine N-acetyltransferase [Paenibacillus mucilaginosus]
MRIGLAQTRFPGSLQDGLAAVHDMLEKAAEAGCSIVCFPEAVLPGLRGVGYEVEAYDHNAVAAAVEAVRAAAERLGVAVILPSEWEDELGLHLVAFVISGKGELLGYQTKNQIDPDEEGFGYMPGSGRRIFEIDGVKLGIVICHEGWRYPETVRWAAREGAAVVFHPQYTGPSPYPEFYGGALQCRSLENGIYFASVNYATQEQGLSSQVISPDGRRLCEAKLHAEELAVCEIDPLLAVGRLAKRLRPEVLAGDLLSAGDGTRLLGERVLLRELQLKDAGTLLELEEANREFFPLFTGTRREDFYTLEGQRNRIGDHLRKKSRDEAYFFGIFHPSSGDLIGTITLMEVLRGALQSCFIGYMLDRVYNGQGRMSEAVRLMVAYAFGPLGLHRIEAGVMPHNAGSIRVLEKAGFVREGLARKNVNINGQWQDHLVFAALNPNGEGPN